MRIEFNIFENSNNWISTAHQINGDILLRNVLMKGQVSDLNVSFTYDETAHCGKIMNNHHQIIGDFEVSL
ncbi:hypothetical protein [Vibrio renipiscarius]|uniref:Uncharacterized protein n=1 Tax=Vibrio renipiscarius TaxID=1461322 RepID=A0A0C2NJK5_9VIBR|nr:hypothetical protein [Vibrio renipiscarius]KII79666.1 hypothetical protein PL18_08410 [Vibrio renipiscarius]KII80707.1 hypothetical protein OJ16_05255 [Vibrio renipiscarius]